MPAGLRQSQVQGSCICRSEASESRGAETWIQRGLDENLGSAMVKEGQDMRKGSDVPADPVNRQIKGACRNFWQVLELQYHGQSPGSAEVLGCGQCGPSLMM